jgi:hypothetical protein
MKRGNVPDPSSPPARLRLRPLPGGGYAAYVYQDRSPNWCVAAAGLCEAEAVGRVLELCGRRGIDVDLTPWKRLLEGRRC